MIKRILFATDFTGISHRAQSYVAQMAAAMQAEVILLHAIEPFHSPDNQMDEQFDGFMKSLKEKAAHKGEDALNAFGAKGIDCRLKVVVDKRWQAVVNAANEEDVDLIVLGSHAVHEDGKVYLGTTSHKVFFSTNKPLMVVPQD